MPIRKAIGKAIAKSIGNPFVMPPVESSSGSAPLSGWFVHTFTDTVTADSTLSAETPQVDTPGAGWTLTPATIDILLVNNTTYGDVAAGGGVAWFGDYFQGPTGAKYIKCIGAMAGDWASNRNLSYMCVNGPMPPTSYRQGVSGRKVSNGTVGVIQVEIMEANTRKAFTASAAIASLNTPYEFTITHDGSNGYTHSVDIGGTIVTANWTGGGVYADGIAMLCFGDWAGSSSYGGWWTHFEVQEGTP